MEGARSVRRMSGSALFPRRYAIPAAGGGQGALCLRGPNLRGSLGPDTRHRLRRPRPAPDKELQLRAGERGGGREPGRPSPRQGADKGARPPAPCPASAAGPPAPWPRPRTLCGSAATCAPGAQAEVRGVSARPAPVRDGVSRAPGASPAPRSYRRGGCSLNPGPRSPEFLPAATSAHSPRGRPGSGALCRRPPLVPVPEPESKLGGMDAGHRQPRPVEGAPLPWRPA